MRLFFFGSLLDRDLFAIAVGRCMDSFDIQPGCLLGHHRRKVAGETYPILVPHPDGRVEGILVDGLTPTEIDRLGYFEGGEYVLTPLPIVDRNGDRAEAHAYVSTGILEDTGDAWRLEAWQATAKERALVETEIVMALHGVITTAEMDELWPDLKREADRRLAERYRQSAG